MDHIWEFMKNSLYKCTVVTTIKGEGVDFMEGDHNWHYKNLDDNLLEEALCQI